MPEMEQDDVAQTYTSAFARLGLGQELGLYVSQKKFPNAYAKPYLKPIVIVLLLLLVGFSVLFWGYELVLAFLRTRRIVGHDVWYYDAQFGLSGVLFLFLWLFLIIPIAYGLLRRKEPERVLHNYLCDLLEAAYGLGISRRFYRRLLSPLKETPLKAQLDFISRLEIHVLKKPILVMCVITAFFAVLDFRSYDLLDKSGLSSTHYWTSQVRHYDWTELKRVEVGCWIYSKGELSLRYSLIFPDNVTVNLFNKLPDRNAIAIAERVEALRTKAHVPKVLAHFTGGIHAGERFAHPSCPEVMTAHYGEEGMLPFYMLLPPDDE
jgi:hypothetical protein